MPNEHWRDSYDSWKTRSPDDERHDECAHRDFELDRRELFAICHTCGHEWLASAEQVLDFRQRLEAEKEEGMDLVDKQKGSHIHGIAHDGQHLVVHYKDGRKGRYLNAPAEHKDKALAADSPGTYIHQNLKGLFKYEKLDE